MTAQRDPDRLIRAFMNEGVEELPDPVYDEVRARIELTRQRAFIGPWRTPDAPRLLKIGLPAAVLVVAAVVGLRLVLGPNVGGPTQTPAPQPSPTPQTLSMFHAASAGPELEPRRYRMLGLASEEFVATLPAGWYHASDGYGGGLVRGAQAADADARLTIMSVGNLVTDPCASAPGGDPGPALDPPVGPTVDDLVAALQALGGMSVSPSVNVNIDGYDAKQVELTPITGTGGCAWYILWTTPPISGETWNASIQAGWSSTLTILDVNGLRWVVITSYRTGASGAADELRQIVDSIELP
jgi:hypothetical protein